MFLSVVAATAVTITRANRASNGGVFLKPYYEDLNAPVTGCTAPCLTVDTQSTQAYPSSGTFGLDGSASATGSGSLALSLTTATANDVLYLSVTENSGVTISSITSSPALSWTQRASVLFSTTYHLETWYAAWASSGTISITVTITGASAVGVVFGIKGANTLSPFDPGVATPGTNSGAGGTAASATISTTNPNDFLIGSLGVHGSPAPTVGTGFTQILSVVSGGSRFTSDEYQVVTTTQSNLAVGYTWTGAHDWAMVADAVVQAAVSFSLPAGSSMYLWSPQFAGATSMQAGALSLQLFADLPAPALDGSSSGTWISGNTFTIAPFSTTQTNDVVMLSIQTYLSGSTVTVSSVSDTLGLVTWQGSARKTLTSCSGTQQSTNVEWYGTAATAVTADTITVTLSATPTAASGIEFGISGADTTTPFDPAAGLPKTGVSACTATAAAPTVSGVSTAADNDFMFAFYGGYTSTTETAGFLAGFTPSLVRTVAGTGDSNAVESTTVPPAQSGALCTFGTSTTYWSSLCDAVMPARKSVTVSFVTTNSAGTVQSTMISGSSATITGANAPISLSSSAGNVPASGYIRVVITAPAGTGLTVFWGNGKPTQFEVSYTYRSQ